MKYYKKVLWPIEVAEGDYCWGKDRICGHFDNEGGHATCSLGVDKHSDLKYDRKTGYVLKPDSCRNLKEV